MELVENDPVKRKAPSKKDQAFVREANPPKELLSKEKKPARFNSKDDKSVIEETRAAQSGMTENRSAENQQIKKTHPTELNEQTKPKKESLRPEKTSKLSNSDLAKIKPEESHIVGDIDIQKPDRERQAKEASKPMIFPQVGGYGLQKGSSTVGETLPQDIRIGDFTALNSDRFTYYTFFARMEEVFRPKWINHVKAAVYTYQQSQRRTREEEFVTQIELLLDKDGNFVRGILHKGSGNEALDLAPVRAFRDALKFPNPPQEMLKDDQLIHLDYQFTVHFVPQYLGTAN